MEGRDRRLIGREAREKFDNDIYHLDAVDRLPSPYMFQLCIHNNGHSNRIPDHWLENPANNLFVELVRTVLVNAPVPVLERRRKST
jgi:hypothetical protein